MGKGKKDKGANKPAQTNQKNQKEGDALKFKLDLNYSSGFALSFDNLK